MAWCKTNLHISDFFDWIFFLKKEEQTEGKKPGEKFRVWTNTKKN